VASLRDSTPPEPLPPPNPIKLHFQSRRQMDRAKGARCVAKTTRKLTEAHLGMRKATSTTALRNQILVRATGEGKT
jgi:hypothetical protein